jgi:prepilin-type N-terminal cleavage/methylation domain-containing protein
MPRLMPVLRAVRRRGLTLPELLVAILLLAIVGGGVTRVMLKQQQFYRDASMTAGARRELRLGASMLPTELRSISSSGGDILTMSESEVVMNAYIGTSIVCGFNGPTTSVPPEPGQSHAHVIRHAAGDRRLGLRLQ